MDVSAIRSGLATRLATITSLANRAYATWPDQVVTPCAIVRPLSLSYDDDWSQNGTVKLEVILLAAPWGTGMSRAQDALDAYLDESGTSSIKAAIEGAPKLGGVADSTIVTGWRDYGPLQEGDIAYLGVKFDVEVIA